MFGAVPRDLQNCRGFSAPASRDRESRFERICGNIASPHDETSDEPTERTRKQRARARELRVNRNDPPTRYPLTIITIVI